MIPKKIHYCWFGRNPLPESALKCIASWRKFFPDYEIIEWNEDNFDVNSIPYTAQAYEAKKYAFVSDYARFKILYDHGGIYFDTDVEVIKSFDDIVAKGAFMGVETGPCNSKKYRNRGKTWIAPGLGMGAIGNMDFYRQILRYYERLSFDGDKRQMTVGEHTTYLFINMGFDIDSSEVQMVDNIYIYPPDYFNPLDAPTGKLRITKNTVTIHWYTKSWLEQRSPVREFCARMYHRIMDLPILRNI